MRSIPALLALALGAGAQEPSPPEARHASPRVVLVAGRGSHGHGAHEHGAGCLLLAKLIEEAVPGVESVVWLDGWPSAEDAFEGASTIVLYMDGGANHPLLEHLAAFDVLMRRGVGLVAIHYALDVPRARGGDELRRWLGGAYEAHWSVNPLWTARFASIPEHPVTRGVGPFAHHDEWYYHMRFVEALHGVTPLLSAHPPASTLARPDGSHSGNPHVRAAVAAGQPQHVAWAYERPGGGRSVGFTGLHFHESFACDPIRKLLLNAILWTAGRDVPEQGVETFRPSPAELAENQDFEKPAPPPRPIPTLGEESPRPERAAPRFRSAVVTSSTPGHRVAIDVPLDGARTLFLVVTDGGDGFSCDWADWIDPRLIGPAGTRSLTELAWTRATTSWGQVRIGHNAGGGPLRVAGRPVERGIGTHAHSVLAFELPAGFERFVAEGGLDDGGTQQAGGGASSVRFEVYTEEPPPESAAARRGGLAPREALLDLETTEDLDVALFAAEPAILSPGNLDVDERGRVWILEVVNYRRHAGTRPEGDRILVLEDGDGDGVAEAPRVFHQGPDVDAALGLCVIGDRVLVSASPEVFFLRDTDGDGRADEKTVLFTKTGDRQHDHAAHAFVLGPDGRLYGCIGNAGAAIHDRDGRPVETVDGHVVRDGGRPTWGGIVFRCELDGSRLEVLGHNFRNEFEVAVDAFGRVWTTDNDDDGNRSCRVLEVLEHGNYGYRDERTGASWRTERPGASASIPERHWHQDDPGVVPNLLVTGAGSPAGLIVYEGELLPPVFQGALIHADAGPQVVRAYPTRRAGAGFAARIVDVVRSRADRFFRPVDVCVAPDGALFVADWYDPGVGGHGMGDLDRGRIYRVAPPGHRASVPAFDLATPAGAVAALSSPNQSVRHGAREALLRHGDDALPELERTWRDVTLHAHVRARSLWLLAELAPRPRVVLEEAVADPDPRLRATALRVALRIGHSPLPTVERLVDDVDPHVRRTAAIALRGARGSRADALWARLAAQHRAGDRWSLEALGIGADGQWDTRVRAWWALDPEGPSRPAGLELVWRARTPLVLDRLVDAFAHADAERRARLLRSLDFHDPSDAVHDALVRLLEDPAGLAHVEAIAARLPNDAYARSPVLRATVNRLLRDARGSAAHVALVERFRLRDPEDEIGRIARGADDEAAARAVAFLLRSGRGEGLRDALRREAEDVRVRLLARLADAEAREARAILLDVACDPAHDRALRERALAGLARDVAAQRALLERVAAGELPGDLALPAAHLLARSPDRNLRREAEAFLPVPTLRGGERLPDSEVLAGRRGDAASGRAVFEARCAECHQIQGRGTRFGPDLTQIGTKLSRQALIESILAPSAAINLGFEGVRLDLEDGRVLTGYVEERTESSVALRQAGGLTEVLPRSAILREDRSTVSLMPADLQRELTAAEFVDLIEFLASCR